MDIPLRIGTIFKPWGDQGRHPTCTSSGSSRLAKRRAQLRHILCVPKAYASLSHHSHLALPQLQPLLRDCFTTSACAPPLHEVMICGHRASARATASPVARCAQRCSDIHFHSIGASTSARVFLPLSHFPPIPHLPLALIPPPSPPQPPTPPPSPPSTLSYHQHQANTTLTTSPPQRPSQAQATTHRSPPQPPPRPGSTSRCKGARRTSLLRPSANTHKES